MTKINKLELERFNISPPELKPKTKTQLINALNSTSYQLDWLAQILGFADSQYWSDLNLSIFEKRKILLNAISCDPEMRFPLNKVNITDYRIINVSLDSNNDLYLLDRTYPTLYLYGGMTYIFNVEQYPTFEIASVKFGGAIPKEDLNQLLFVIDRREEGYIIVTPSENITSITETSYYGFNISTGLRETDWGLIKLLPKQHISDWTANRKSVKKDTTLDSWQDNGVTWYGAQVYDNTPIYPKYNRTDNPPDGFKFVDTRPNLVAEEDYFSAQVFRYDNDFFRSEGLPELIYRPSVFYDFFGIHGSKGAAFSFNFMVDALGYKGFNDKTIVVDSIQTTFTNAVTRSYQEGIEYLAGQVIIYNNENRVPALEGYLLQSWYYVKRTFTSVNIAEDLKSGVIEAIASPRKTIKSMQKDTRNDTIPLRLWAQKDLQVTDVNNLYLYDNKLVADSGYTNGEEIGIYHIRLPLEYDRNGVAWQRITLLAKTYLYFGDEEPEEISKDNSIRHQDYRIGYAYFAAGYSAADEAVFDPDLEASQFAPKFDPRKSLYVKNRY